MLHFIEGVNAGQLNVPPVFFYCSNTFYFHILNILYNHFFNILISPFFEDFQITFLKFLNFFVLWFFPQFWLFKILQNILKVFFPRFFLSCLFCKKSARFHDKEFYRMNLFSQKCCSKLIKQVTKVFLILACYENYFLNWFNPLRLLWNVTTIVFLCKIILDFYSKEK